MPARVAMTVVLLVFAPQVVVASTTWAPSRLFAQARVDTLGEPAIVVDELGTGLVTWDHAYLSLRRGVPVGHPRVFDAGPVAATGNVVSYGRGRSVSVRLDTEHEGRAQLAVGRLGREPGR